MWSRTARDAMASSTSIPSRGDLGDDFPVNGSTTGPSARLIPCVHEERRMLALETRWSL